jgi:WD40 repeat protein
MGCIREKKLNVPLLGEGNNIPLACLNPTGTKLARIGGDDDIVDIYDFHTKKQLSFKPDIGISTMYFINPSVLALGGTEGQVIIVGKENKKLVSFACSNKVDNDNNAIMKIYRIKAMSYNKNTSSLATISFHNQVCILEDKLERREATSRFNTHYSEDKDIHKICYDTSGNYLLVVVNDQQSVYLIDTKNWTSKLIDKPQNMSLLGIYFDAKDQSFKLLLFAGSDEIRVYDIEKKYTTKLIVAPAQFTAHSAIIDPSGRYLAVAGEKLGELFVRLYAYKQFTSQ